MHSESEEAKPVRIKFSPDMRETICTEVKKVRENRGLLDVHALADLIQQRHSNDNVALEDIAEAIISVAGSLVPMKLGTEMELTRRPVLKFNCGPGGLGAGGNREEVSGQ